MTLRGRLARWQDFLTTPSWRRDVATRRLIATILLVVAAGLLVADALRRDPQVWVASTTIAAGTQISDGQLTRTTIPQQALPPGAAKDKNQLIGAIAATSFLPGEVLSTHRLVSPEAINTVSPQTWHNPTMVPVTVADSHIHELLHHGDTVTVLYGPMSETPGAIIAEGVKVLSPQHASPQNHVIIVVADAPVAQHIAQAALIAPVGVMITGTRAHPTHQPPTTTHN